MGTSSSEVRRRKRPAAVTRGSSRVTIVPTPTGSEPWTIVRSFHISNSRAGEADPALAVDDRAAAAELDRDRGGEQEG